MSETRSPKPYLLAALIAGILIAAALWYLYRHRHPFTQNAFLYADTRAVTALVPGYLAEIHVANNQQVKKGDPLITIYREPYRLALESLRAQLDAQDAAIRALEAKIRAAQSTLTQLEFEFKNLRYLDDKAQIMAKEEVVSRSYAEQKQRARQAGEAALAAQRHTIEALEFERRQSVAARRSLERKLAAAEIDYRQSVVYALADGTVTNVNLAPGAYCNAGETLFAFVDTKAWYIQANFPESELAEIQPGMAAKIWLWQYPGRTFHGVVCAIHFSAERRSTAATGLPEVEKENEWFLLPQRFPVQIKLADPPDDLVLHTGASAYVQLDCSSRQIRQFFWRLFLR